MEINIIINETDEKILKNDISDIQAWVDAAVSGKIDACWGRFQAEWTMKLMNDESFTDSIPSNKADFITLVTSREDYKNREERDSQALEE